MDRVKSIVPWKCHVCAKEFDMGSGGTCSRCKRATCRRHLNRVGDRSDPASKWVCENCLAPEEKGRWKRWFQF